MWVEDMTQAYFYHLLSAAEHLPVLSAQSRQRGQSPGANPVSYKEERE